MLIAEGLLALGEYKKATALMKNFIKLVEGGGFAENYDAITGTGLRDKSYTWTASMYLYFLDKLQTLKES